MSGWAIPRRAPARAVSSSAAPPGLPSARPSAPAGATSGADTTHPTRESGDSAPEACCPLTFLLSPLLFPSRKPLVPNEGESALRLSVVPGHWDDFGT